MANDYSELDASLLMEVIKLEGKLSALQRVSGLTLPENQAVGSNEKKPTKLVHATSATSTDYPDNSSTTEAMDTPRDSDDDQVSSESDGSE